MSRPVFLLLLLAACLAPCAQAQSWEWQYPRPTGNLLTAVAFADALHGTAVGAAGTIISTTDGGVSWQSVVSGATDDLQAITFVTAQRGWIAGGGGG